MAPLIFLASCTRHEAPSISSGNPDAAIPAIKTRVAAGDRSAIPYLVNDLESRDAAIRMYAIHGLVHLTGVDLGYTYYAPPEERKPAVARWKQWLKDNSH